LIENAFFESILDNIQNAVYVLDDKGNYVFVNSAYVQMLNMSKSELLNFNVKQFVETNQINISVSDIVYRERRRVVMFQDVYDTQQYGRGNFRHLIISTPIFDERGEVKNIVAVSRPLDSINDDYNEASMNSIVAKFSKKADSLSALWDSSIIAESPAMRKVLELATNIADAESTVLISGESGTGKEVVAQYIHAQSERSEKPLVVINCASLPETLLEAELFGYEKGAFTGAASGGKPGLFECADGGTLFLDEINSLPLDLQGKLLRAIETKMVQRVGSTKSRQIDFRLLVATNERLDTLVAERRFRIDLYYRINVIHIRIPPLRERQEDIIPMTMHFMKIYCKKNNKHKTFSEQTLESMLEYPWPGNVRELKNFVERSVVMSFGEIIEAQNIQAITADGITTGGSYGVDDHVLIKDKPQYIYEHMLNSGISLEQYLEECEYAYVKYALQTHKTSYAAAQALGTSQTSIMRRKKKFGL